MASLSTCHLGLWLGWQILLNLESSDSDTESDSEAIPVPDSVRDTEGSEGDVDEFNMLTTDMDAAIERAVAVPEFVLPEQDNILLKGKATAFRCGRKLNGGEPCCSLFSVNGVKAAGHDALMEMTPRLSESRSTR
ncbi:hypothetical protein LSAT2_010849 [Lamellibrachia satsuma]|nr:hypothetical protein LSAT2_010849 [Lamellibrachia satsuma]